jgi:hypothetical protein
MEKTRKWLEGSERIVFGKATLVDPIPCPNKYNDLIFLPSLLSKRIAISESFQQQNVF